MIPKALRPILGQNKFKKSLGTSNKTEAELRSASLILHWKKLIDDAKTDGITAKAKALRSALDNRPNNDFLDEDGFWESTKTGIIEDAFEDIILGGRDINSIDKKLVPLCQASTTTPLGQQHHHLLLHPPVVYYR